MTKEKIKAKLPIAVNVIQDLKTNKTIIAHDGAPIGVSLPECGMSLDWYREGSDLLFKSEAETVELHIQYQNSRSTWLRTRYNKLTDTAAHTRFGLERVITYTAQLSDAGRQIEIDASLVEAYRQRVAEEK